ncbi:hypothetical protein [Paraburkholderia sp. D1E]|uniref:hypothetical protein n=1 Tax=Paraburkholderia sp. D1E TaxID=3461398 RepID=UPI0040460566
MNTLLKRLRSFLFPGVDDGNDPDAGDDPAGDPSAGDPAAGADDLDDLEIDLVEDTPAPTGRASSSDDRLARLEAEVERRGRLAAEATRNQPPQADPELQREEERLRSADITDQERWQINANRVLRDTQRQANQALFQAQDIADRTQFEAKIATDPRRDKYRDRVEQAVQEERRAGRHASRESVYFYMLGKDIADGKLRPKAKAKTPAADIPRGRAPNTRSDVQGRGRATEHDKRRARLENQNI